MKPFDVLTIGENSVDSIAVVEVHPQANAKVPLLDYQELPGGEAASAAVGLARLGWSVGYIGRLGDDRFGALLRQHLTAERVDISHCVVVENHSSRFAVIVVERSSGARTVLWQRDPALALQPHDIPDAALVGLRALLVGSDDVAAMTSAARRAQGFGVATFGDLERLHEGTEELLRNLDVIVMASSFPAALTGEPQPGAALRRVAEMSGASVVCVTLGADGSLALAEGREVHVSGFPVEVIDSTGAGDLFRAGLISRWLETSGRGDLEDLLRYANAVAALNCRAVGAHTAAPRPDELAALIGG